VKRRLLTLGALTAAAALAAGPAWALWTSNASGSARAKSVDMPTGGILTAPPAGDTPTNSSSVSVAWPAADYVPAVSVKVPSYIVKRYIGTTPVLDTNALSASCGGSTGIVSATSCTDTLPASGTYRYSVTPLTQVTPSSGNWVGTEGPKSGTVSYTAAAADTSAPTWTAICPASGGNYTLTGSGTWAGTCGGKVSGTVTDATGISKVEISVQDTSVTNGCFTTAGGSSFDQACDRFIDVTSSASGSAYSLTINQAKMTPGRTYRVKVRTTDSLTNSAVVANYTYSVT
jgi:hypothetical protein